MDVANENWTLDVANEKLDFDVANEKLDFDVANKKLGFGGMRYVQWAHRANFGFCQVLKEKNRAKYVVFGFYGNGLYRDPIW